MFTLMFYTGCLVIIFCFLFKREIIRIEWDKVAKFSAFLLLVAAIRFSLMEGANTSSGFIPSFRDIPLVPWEDSFFSLLLIYFFKDYLNLSKKVWIPIAVASSFLFASGHIIYGATWATMTLFFPYFLSYKYGKKYGYGTVMVMHVLYDFTTILTVKLVTVTNLLNRY